MSSPPPSPPLLDVLIVGGGAAGIAAAIQLQRQGLSSLIVEARDRLGGRVWSNEELGVPVDMGASWLHHCSPSHPLLPWAWRLGAVLGQPPGGGDLFTTIDGQQVMTAEDHAMGCSFFQQMERERGEEVMRHQRTSHAQSPFMQVEWKQYGQMRWKEKMKESGDDAHTSVDAAASTTSISSSSSSSTPATSPSFEVTSFHDPSTSMVECSERCAAHDTSFATWMQQQGYGSGSASDLLAASVKKHREKKDQQGNAPPVLSPAAASVAASLIQFTQNVEGASLPQLSLAHSGEELPGLPSCNLAVTSGFGSLLEQIASFRALEYVLNTEVDSVKVGLDGVEVQGRKVEPQDRKKPQHGSSANPITPPDSASLSSSAADRPGTPVTYHARYCLMTVPLGTLKHGRIRFDPVLPQWKLDGIDRMGWGLLGKIVLQFDQAWWKTPQVEYEVSEQERQQSQEDEVDDANSLFILPSSSSPSSDGSLDRGVRIVSLSRPLSSLQRLQQAQLAEASTAGHPGRHGAAWRQHVTRNSRPRAPAFQPPDRDVSVGENMSAEELALYERVRKEEWAPVQPRKAVDGEEDASSSATSSAPSTGSPHVLVAFTSNFDLTADGTPESLSSSSASPAVCTRSSLESQPDSVIISSLMRRLRRAFQGGMEEALPADKEAEMKQLHGKTVQITMAHTSSEGVQNSEVQVESGEDGSPSSSSLPLPHSFLFHPPRFHSHTLLARRVPDPSGYLISRWSLDEHAGYGTYSFYQPGTGPETCAVLARPVSVRRKGEEVVAVEEEEEDVHPNNSADASNDSSSSSFSSSPISTRLLFAGEATLGLHLGCVDSAWLSGEREAKRIQQLWQTQEANKQAV